MASPLYQVEKTCPICEKAFTVTKTRGQSVPVKTDTDFCTHYNDINPYYFAIWVCSNCGFAAHEDRFFTLLEPQREKLKQFLAGRQVNLDFGGPRTWEQAVTSHKLAIHYANMISLSASHVASLTLRLAWLYREKELIAEEQDMLRKAIEAYKAAFLKEKMPIGNLSEVTLTYLIWSRANPAPARPCWPRKRPRRWGCRCCSGTSNPPPRPSRGCTNTTR